MRHPSIAIGPPETPSSPHRVPVLKLTDQSVSLYGCAYKGNLRPGVQLNSNLWGVMAEARLGYCAYVTGRLSVSLHSLRRIRRAPNEPGEQA